MAAEVAVESSVPATVKSGDVSKVIGQCGYCNKPILLKEKILPLECTKCKGLYHVRCLRGVKPPVFLGDNLYFFTCSPCSTTGKESWERPHLQWVYVTHLALYNLIMNGRGGRRGFYRWNEDICGFIRSNWSVLMPYRKKTQSWHSTVAGTLSVHCPTTFKSGYSLFGEHGWWTLTSTTPPSLKAALWTAVSKKQPIPSQEASSPPPAKRQKMFPLPTQGQPVDMSPLSRPRLGSGKGSLLSPTCLSESGSSPPPPLLRVRHPEQGGNQRSLPSGVGSNSSSLVPMTEQQEKILLEYLEQCSLARQHDPRASRLMRKLNVRVKQRLYNLKTFDLDALIYRLLSTTVKYVVDDSLPYYEQVVSHMSTGAPDSSRIPPYNRTALEARLNAPTSAEVEVLDQLCVIPLLSRALPPQYKTFRQMLCGSGTAGKEELITSPYTARKLKPFIFRSSDIVPRKVGVNTELYQRFNPSEDNSSSIDFCYFQEHHLPAVNNLISYFFWPVDLSECLQYPDFTCVVLYKKLLVGCAFMTPDVKVNEAYISFLVVHPDFQGHSIGKIMLYHLIQSCMGKDITLHVSVDNPAMLLYQSLGFKTERYCLGFYNNFYPDGHYLSKNAYFMRLRK